MLTSQWVKSSYSFSNGNCVEVRWRKSSASESGNCVEVARGFRKSSASYGTGNCVEVASCACDADPGFRKSSASMNNGNCGEVGAIGGMVLVRDTKQDGRDDRTVLPFTPAAWRSFLAGVKRDG